MRWAKICKILGLFCLGLFCLGLFCLGLLCNLGDFAGDRFIRTRSSHISSFVPAYSYKELNIKHLKLLLSYVFFKPTVISSKGSSPRLKIPFNIILWELRFRTFSGVGSKLPHTVAKLLARRTVPIKIFCLQSQVKAVIRTHQTINHTNKKH